MPADAAVPMSHALIQNDIVVFGLIAATLGAVFWTSSRPSGPWKRLYTFVPALLLCYLIPGIYNTTGRTRGSTTRWRATCCCRRRWCCSRSRWT